MCQGGGLGGLGVGVRIFGMGVERLNVKTIVVKYPSIFIGGEDL